MYILFLICFLVDFGNIFKWNCFSFYMTNSIGEVVALNDDIGVSDDDNVANLLDFRDSKDSSVGRRRFLYKSDCENYDAICRRQSELDATLVIDYRRNLYVKE